MKREKYKLKRHIPAKGYPLNSPYYQECHAYATKKEIERYGLHRFHQVGILIAQHPHELLGKNDPERRRYISLIVPKIYWEQIDYHEKIEADCINRKIRHKST